jgi:hypothetical protein
LRTQIEKAYTDFPNARIALKGDETAVLQTIALLSGRIPKRSKLADELRKSDISQWWDKVISGFDSAINILDDFGCGCRSNLSLLPYRPVLPIVAALCVHKDFLGMGVGPKAKFKDKIEKMFYHTALTVRYTEGTDNKVNDDFLSMSRWIDGGEVPQFMQDSIPWNLDKFVRAKTGGAIGRAVLCAINKNRPDDFYLGHPVGVGQSLNACDKHHIFPKAKYPHDLKDSVFNITFLSKESNNFIKDKRTSEYYDELLKLRDLTDSQGKAIFAKHFIADDVFRAFRDEKFEQFIKLRANSIKSYFENIGLVFFDVTDADIDSVTEDELEEEEITD